MTSHAQTVLTGDTYPAPEVIITPNWDVNENLIIGNGGSGTMTTTEGATVNSLTGIIGLGTDSHGDVIVSGSGSEWNNTAGLIVGDAGTGILHILDGAVVTSSNPARDVVIAKQAGSAGHMVVSGAGSQFQSDHVMYIGQGGNGLLEISDGANVTTHRSLFIGNDVGSIGNLTVTGNDTTLNTSALRIGERGIGTASITGGAKASSAWFFIGTNAGSDGELLVSGADTVLELSDTSAASRIGSSGKGKLTLADGALLHSKGSALSVGSSAGSDGQLIVTGEGTRLHLDKSLTVGSSGMGRMDILDGAEVIVLTNTYIGSAPLNDSGHGMLTLQGNSTFNTSTLYVGMNGADGILNIGAAEGEAAATAGKLTTKSGISLGYGTGKGVINFNHTASDYEFNSKIEGTGDVNVIAGTTLMTAKNTYRGATTIDGGTLALKGLGGIANSSYVALNSNESVLDISTVSSAGSEINNLSGIVGSQVVLSDKTLSVNNSNDTVYAGDIAGHGGGLTKLGERTLTLAGSTAYTGNTRLNKGQLVLDGSIGGAQLSSNVLALSGTQLSMVNGASLTGTIGSTSVNIDGASRWNMTQSSDVDEVVNLGLIDFIDPVPGNILTIQGDYISDNGRLTLNSVLGGDESVSDKLVVEGDTYGTTLVSVNNAGGSGAATLNGIELVQVNGTSGGEFIKNGRIVAGAYDYSLVRGVGSNATNWYLTSAALLTPPTDPELPITPKSPTNPELPMSPESTQIGPMTQRPESGAYSANLAAANTMFVSRLHDRLGETQYIDALTGEQKVTSLWLRNEGGHNRSR
ncbi:autotransporter outer membrane beta-barrel domain-containing protein, partial [Yersinia frederiksenii]|uniref:autotransporter outer membrane beta-barrel domain-containing protein n=1 Tax=Yersinia frederiksenii TaxID=29484 RepID=UPI00067B8438